MATRKVKLSICIVLILFAVSGVYFIVQGFNSKPIQPVKPPRGVAVCEPASI